MPKSTDRARSRLHRIDPVALTREFLLRERYVASPLLAAQVYLLLCDAADGRSIPAMCVEGFPGTGKSSLAAAFSRIRARLSGGPAACIKISVYGSTTVRDVMYGAELRTIEKIDIDPKVYDELDWVRLNRMGALPAAFKLAESFPVTLMVDEFDKLQSGSPMQPDEPSSVEGWLLSVLGEGKLPVKGQKPLKAPLGNLTVFLGKNYRRSLTPELRRRARLVHVDFPTPDVEIPLLAGEIGPGRRRNLPALSIAPVPSLPRRLAEFLVTSVASKIRAQAKSFTLIPPTEVLGKIGRDALRLVAAGHPELVEPVILSWLIAREDELAELKSRIGDNLLRTELVRVAKQS